MHLQDLVDNFKSKLKQIEMKEAQGAKIHGKTAWMLKAEKHTKYFFQKLKERKNADQECRYTFS